jgi:hypothetical protein
MLCRVAQAGAVVQRLHQQWHWLFECGSRALSVGNMTLQQTVLKIAILLRFGIEKLQKCVYLVSPCHPVRIEQREAN